MTEVSSENIQLTTVDHVDLFDHLDREVAVLVDDSGLPWGQTLHVCLSQQSLEEKIARFKRHAAVMPLGKIIEFLLHNDREQLNIYGFALGDYALERGELEKIAYAIETFSLLWTCYKEKLTQTAAFDLLKTRTFYYLGNPVLSGTHSTFNFDTVMQKGHEFVKVYISKESANGQNYQKLQAVPVNLAHLRLFVEGKYGIVIEANRRYHLKF